MKKNLNYLGIIAAIIMIIAVFLPWATASGGGASESAMGFEFADVKISVLLLLLGAFMAYRRTRWAVILIGIISLLQGLLHLCLYLFADNLASGASGGIVGMNPSIGLVLYILAAIVFIFSSKKPKEVKAAAL